jgi:uncharacterized protein YndB with AHSA1/START domain
MTTPSTKITIETTVAATMADVWRAWNTPQDIKQWNAASPDWHTTAAAVDLRVGGKFSSRMEAKDGSMGFDFTGVYTKIDAHKLIEYTMSNGRRVHNEFMADNDRVTLRVIFDAESENPIEMQRQGWQAILDSFAKHVAAVR